MVADGVDAFRGTDRYLDDRAARPVWRGQPELPHSVEDPGRLAVEVRSDRVAPPGVERESGLHGRERGHGGRPGEGVRGGGRLEVVLHLGRAGEEGQQGRVGLGEARDQDDPVVALADMADEAVAPAAVGAQFVGSALADDAETVCVVDVEERVVRAGHPGQFRHRRDVAGHAVQPVDAHQPRVAAAGPQHLLELGGVVVVEALHGRAPGPGHEAAVVDGAVRVAVEEDCSLPGEGWDDRQMDVRDRGKRQAVLGAEQVGELLLDLDEQPWGRDHP